jgi:hypothetical protein
MVEPQIVVLVVAGSSPVGHPFLRVKELKKLHRYNGLRPPGGEFNLVTLLPFVPLLTVNGVCSSTG